MIGQIFKRAGSVRSSIILGIVFLLAGCGLEITQPQNGSYALNKNVFSEVKFKQNRCGSFRALLDGNDVTGKFSGIVTANTNPLITTFYDLPLGPHTLSATAELVRQYLLPNRQTFSDCIIYSDAVKFTVGETRDSDYMKICRAQGVPIPPDWIPPDGVIAQPITAWQLIGRTTSIITSDLGKEINLYAYSDPYVRGACIARAAFDGGSFGFICQSATTGHACFWQFPNWGWTKDHLENRGITKVEISTIDTGFGRNDCTQCHRGNNVFIFDPNETVYEKLMGNMFEATQVASRLTRIKGIGSNFTVRVEASSDVRTVNLGGGTHHTYPRFIPIGGGGVNPLPVKSLQTCSGACHENHKDDISANGVSFPNLVPETFIPWMPPRCSVVAGLAAPDPTFCYQ